MLQNLPVTNIVDHLMEFKNSQEMEEYHYLDPKQIKLTDIPRNRSPFQDAIVFIVGGGNYIEYQNLVDYAKVGSSLNFCFIKFLFCKFQFYFSKKHRVEIQKGSYMEVRH